MDRLWGTVLRGSLGDQLLGPAWDEGRRNPYRDEPAAQEPPPEPTPQQDYAPSAAAVEPQGEGD